MDFFLLQRSCFPFSSPWGCHFSSGRRSYSSQKFQWMLSLHVDAHSVLYTYSYSSIHTYFEHMSYTHMSFSSNSHVGTSFYTSFILILFVLKVLCSLMILWLFDCFHLSCQLNIYSCSFDNLPNSLLNQPNLYLI